MVYSHCPGLLQLRLCYGESSIIIRGNADGECKVLTALYKVAGTEGDCYAGHLAIGIVAFGQAEGQLCPTQSHVVCIAH